MHSEPADWENNLKAACEADRDLLQRRGRRALNAEWKPCGYDSV